MKVWINGCFDVLHYGHFQMINYAQKLGDELIIGIDTDERVKELKGSDRPFHTVKQRRFNLQRIKGVTKVVTFKNEGELIWHIKNEEPTIMVIGEEYKNKNIIGKELFKEINYFPKVKGFSTTKLLV